MNPEKLTSLTKEAYAKINLGLRILRKRDDNFHEIETVFHRVLPSDQITFERSTGISLTVDHPDVSADERNLCFRAATLVRQRYGVKDGVTLRLTKHIPIGAGLGGGSSDAAATLRGLASFWEIDVSETALTTLALKLGSDVPYFLREGTAYATGRGEQLSYFGLDLPYWILVVYPNIQVSTTWAYQQVRVTTHQSHQTLRDILLENITDLQTLRQKLHNDFEPSVLATHPQIAQLKRTIYDRGAGFAQLSGSGSSVYGLFEDEASVRSALEHFRTKYPAFLTPPHFQGGRSESK